MIGGASVSSVGGRVLLESGYSGATSSGALIIQVSFYTVLFEDYITSCNLIHVLPKSRPYALVTTDRKWWQDRMEWPTGFKHGHIQRGQQVIHYAFKIFSLYL